MQQHTATQANTLITKQKWDGREDNSNSSKEEMPSEWLRIGPIIPKPTTEPTRTSISLGAIRTTTTRMGGLSMHPPCIQQTEKDPAKKWIRQKSPSPHSQQRGGWSQPYKRPHVQVILYLERKKEGAEVILHHTDNEASHEKANAKNPNK